MTADFKKVVILESGLWEMKLGFSGDECSRFVQQSIVGFPKNPAITISAGNKDIFVGKEVSENHHILDIHSTLLPNWECDWEILEKLWHNLLYGSLKIELQNFPLFVIMNNFFDKQRKMKLVELMFENYTFPSLYMQSSNVTGLFYDGRTTGMVLDSGFSQTNCMSIFEGYPIEEKLLKSSFGGRSLNNYFIEMINKAIEQQKGGFTLKSDFYNYYGYKFPERYYEKLRMDLLSQGFGSKRAFLPDNNEIILPGEEFKKYEAYCIESMGNMINDCFKAAEEKYKSEFSSNISLIGGNTIVSDIETSLVDYLSAKEIKQFTISSKTDDEKRFASWIGGSLLASIDNLQSLLVKRAEYNESGAEAIIKKNLL